MKPSDPAADLLCEELAEHDVTLPPGVAEEIADAMRDNFDMERQMSAPGGYGISRGPSREEEEIKRLKDRVDYLERKVHEAASAGYCRGREAFGDYRGADVLADHAGYEIREDIDRAVARRMR